MTIIYTDDRVKETTTTTGAGTVNLNGALVAFHSFAQAFSDQTLVYYGLLSGNGTDWEIGQGTFIAGSPNMLSRDVVLRSTNNNALINLTGQSIVFTDLPANMFQYFLLIGNPAMLLAATALFGGI